MRRLSVFFMCAACLLPFIGGGTQFISVSAAEHEVYIGGMSAGFTLKTGGLQIVGLSEVTAENGVKSPSIEAKLRTGDVIQKIGGIRVETIAELNEVVDKSKGKSINIEILRGDERMQLSIQPVKEKVSNRYKIGVLVRENVSGIGTVTYIDKQTGRFGALGHSVVGENHQEMLRRPAQRAQGQ
jgi:stage IV sporulation protein B